MRGYLTNPSTQHHRLRAIKWSVLRQHRSLPHALRRAYHVVMGLLCFSLYAWVIDRNEACWLLALLGGPFVLLDILRLQSPGLRNLALQYFGPLMRREEIVGLTGNSFFIVGMFIVVFFFSKPVALLSVLYLAIGDPIAAFVGTRWGKHRMFAGKSLEGAAANFTASALATSLFASLYMGMEGALLFVFSLTGGLVSTVAELIPVPIDDNVSVPVLSAIGLELVLLLLL